MPKKKDSFTLRIERTPDPKNGNAKSRGAKSGLGICEFISALFEANEELPKSRKMTDEEIKRQILLEFPDRKGAKSLQNGSRTVGYWRSMFNLGKLTGGAVPKKPSRRYTIDGLLANLKTGRPITPSELELMDG